jgi:hypothetical protein
MKRNLVGTVVTVTAGILVLGGCATPGEGSASSEEPRREEAPKRDEPTESRSTRSDASRSAGSGASAGSESRGRETTPPTDTAKLVADLNEASRELAALRTQNARLRAGLEAGGGSRAAAPVAAPSTPSRSDPTDEKLAAAFKSYGALKQELAGVLADLEKARAESSAAAARLRDVSSRTDDSRAAVAKLESELRAERRAREAAEQKAEKLQEQLRTIARALSAAGLSVEKLSEGKRE